ncbi:MAG: isocitrate dehydrogenase [Candidatus Wenzhouxiangella sp. M2_3B_020]
MTESTAITVIRGDGIGPEITDVAIRVLDALDIGFDYDYRLAGLAGQEETGSLLPEETLESIERTRLVLKGPLTTPVGGGFRSLNVELRKRFDLYANVRPAISFPGTRARYDNIDLITVRENTEGAYLAADAFTSEDGTRAESKMVATRAGCERVLRYAFELARSAGRRKVTAVHKANILKDVSGLFLNVARELAEEYGDIEFDDIIVDNCCMQLVMNPERFDVMVTTNLFGDIISDLCAGLVGGLGLAPGANIGDRVAMFEAVHGSAPDIAGQGIANPCALILGAAQMLDHLERPEEARRVRAAVRSTISDGDRVTPDLGGTGTTERFGEAIVARLNGR